VSFNGSGTFVINSTGQPVVTGTVISSSTFNSLTADLGTGLSTTVTKDGQTTTTAKIPFALGLSAAAASNFAAGTVGLPAIYLSTDTTTGLYRIGANNDGFAVSGAKVLDIASTGLGITGTLKLAGATSGTTTVIATDAVTATITLPSATSTLATFVASTFTPVMAIGAGAPTSYTTQVGNYLQIGTAGNGRVFFTITVRLNVAGAATGNVTFTGLPVAARAGAATERNSAAVYMTGAGGLGLTTEQIWATVAQGASVVDLWTYTGGTASAFSVGALSNSQQFNINGSYPI